MYIAIYVSGIILLFVAGLVIFALVSKKNKKRKAFLEQKAREETPIVVQESIMPKTSLEKTEEEEKPEQMDSFNMGEEQSAASVYEKYMSQDDSDFDDNYLAQDAEFDDNNLSQDSNFNNEEPSEEQTVDIDQRFKEYEEFLKANLGDNMFGADQSKPKTQMFDDDISKPEPSSDFEYDFKDTETEIEKMLEKLPPKMQQIMLSEILARKNFDDDDKN